MSYKSHVAGLESSRWPIALATHVGTEIPNETSKPLAQVSKGHATAEERFRSLFRRCVREPLSGYNCFGCVFATRRTSIYETATIATILAEDGYGEITEEELQVGDVVLYMDDAEPNHAARVVRVEPTALVGIESVGAVESRAVVVLSKFGDMSGEYEHYLEDLRWAEEMRLGRWVAPKLDRRCYRDRHKTPEYPAGWRAAVRGIQSAP